MPVLLMVACNVLDYATGLMASTYRSQDINSYKSIKGIMKKVCMWLLVEHVKSQIEDKVNIDNKKDEEGK